MSQLKQMKETQSGPRSAHKMQSQAVLQEATNPHLNRSTTDNMTRKQVYRSNGNLNQTFTHSTSGLNESFKKSRATGGLARGIQIKSNNLSPSRAPKAKSGRSLPPRSTKKASAPSQDCNASQTSTKVASSCEVTSVTTWLKE